MKPVDGVNLHTLEESSDEVLALSEEEARGLSRVGRKLASNEKWWSGTAESAVERTIIKCAADSGGWRVRVQDAVGAVSAAGAQIVVHPKIPLDHLLYLFERSRRDFVPAIFQRFCFFLRFQGLSFSKLAAQFAVQTVAQHNYLDPRY